MTTKTKQTGSTAREEAARCKPRLLQEGWLDEGCEGDPVFYPERAYVVQTLREDGVVNKVWFAYGKDRALDESFGSVRVVESYDELELVEKRAANGETFMLPKDGRWVVEGPSQRSDVKNANQRTYSRKIWEKLIADGDSYVQVAIRERRMIGHLEHPKDGRTDLRESAILTTVSKLLEDGTVWGQFEILDTPNGRILQELTRKKIKWGVSSRGTGTVGDDGQVSEEDYRLKTWDAVASPSTPGAHPTLVTGRGRQHEALDETYNEWMRELRRYPSARVFLPKISAALSWDISGAAGFSLALLEDVNVSEGELRAIASVFDTVLTSPVEDAKNVLAVESNTEEGAQGALPEDLQRTLDQFAELAESEPDNLSGRIKLRRQLLDGLASLDESALQRLLQRDQGWAKVMAAVEKARQSEEDGASVDAAIEEALASGEAGEDTAGFEEVIETLQEQVSDSVQENVRLQERLEAAESERRAQAERLVEAEGELARVRAERDLAHELLSETPGRSAGDVTAAADEAIGEVPVLEEYRALLESVGSPAQVRTLAERLVPSPVKETEKEAPKSVARTALPVGLALDETDHKPSSPKRDMSESRGASIVASMPGFKK
jgi:hypothetical protein